MAYLIDTNIVSYAVKNKELRRQLLEKARYFAYLPSIAVFELLYGIERKKNGILTAQVYTIINEFETRSFCKTSAIIASKLLVSLQKQGKTIDRHDLYIACIALANNMTLVTNNTKHFQHITNLALEDWSK